MSINFNNKFYGVPAMVITAITHAGKNPVRFPPAVSLAVGVVATVGLVACSAYHLYQASSVPDSKDGNEKQLKLPEEGIEKEFAEEKEKVTGQINRHSTLRDKYKEIYANTSITRRTIHAIAVVAVTSLLAAAVNPLAAGVVAGSAVVVAVPFVLAEVVKKGIYGYLIRSHDRAVNKISIENRRLLSDERLKLKDMELARLQGQLTDANRALNEANAMEQAQNNSALKLIQLQSQLTDANRALNEAKRREKAMEQAQESLNPTERAPNDMLKDEDKTDTAWSSLIEEKSTLLNELG